MRSLVIIILLLCSMSLFAETITIATDEYEPYVIVDEDGNHSGVIVEIVKKSFEKVNIDVIFENYPYIRGIKKLERNEVDATMPKFKTEERMKKYLFTDPIIESTSKIFYVKGRKIKDDFKWKTLDDFKKYKVGGTIGYWYLEEFEKIGLIADISSTDESNIRKLYIGRVDVFIIDEITGWELIRKFYSESVDKFAVVEREESKAELCLMLNKNNLKSDRLMKKFSEGLKLLKESGEYNKIISKVCKH